MLLQAMANQFGLPVTEYADAAFKVDLTPRLKFKAENATGPAPPAR